ncbi:MULTISPECIES: hypothetical protein [Roseibium]|uniref:hypothetical protein n=1 Tax=Roseibium TaxID=150830 RepID=UPI003750FABD
MASKASGLSGALIILMGATAASGLALDAASGNSTQLSIGLGVSSVALVLVDMANATGKGV